MSRRFDPIVTLEEVTKVYINRGKAVAFDTILYHIRGENVGRNKAMNNLLRELTDQVADGTATIPVQTEE
jgi:hypothetical protein